MVRLGNQKAAVLTGDVIQSRGLENYGPLLDQVLDEFEAHYRETLPAGVDRYAGDRFQILVEDCRWSLRCALSLFSRLASLEDPIPVRLSVGLGAIKRIPNDRVSMGEGEAFRLSGSNLDSMKKHQRLLLEASQGLLGPRNNRLLRGASDLLSGLLVELSVAQAEVLWYMLRDYTQDEIADETDRKQQTISEISIAGHWRNIEGFLTVFEDVFSDDEN